VTPPCIYFGECGGCALQHLKTEALGDFKRDVLIHSLAQRGIDVQVGPTLSIPPGDRRRVVFKATKQNGSLVLGFNRRAAHDVIDIDACLLVDPALAALIAPLRIALQKLLPDRGWAKLHATVSPVGIDLTVDASQAARDLGLKRTIALADDLGLARLTWNNELVVERTKPRIAIEGILVELPPRSFLQASISGEARLISAVRDHVGPAKLVIDLFSGLGTFSLPLAKTARVLAFDSEAPAIHALAAASRTHEGLKPVTATVRDLYRAPLTPEEMAKADAVIFDPPRAGAEAQARHLAQSKVPVVVAVSCDPGSFARDARILIDGGYSLQSVQVVDQFVWSPHIELVALFSRPKEKKRQF
jgi:23S rRNA (uracil1939-C5)-methyltransferase